MKTAGLILHQTFRALGNTKELLSKFAYLCQGSLFLYFLDLLIQSLCICSISLLTFACFKARAKLPLPEGQIGITHSRTVIFCLLLAKLSG